MLNVANSVFNVWVGQFKKTATVQMYKTVKEFL